MPTALFNKARTAGVIALTLLTVAAVAVPAQAASILRDGGFSIEIGGSSDNRDRHDDCDSRREIKYYFQDKYDLRHVDVSKTHDYYIYRVSGYAQPAKEQPAALLREKSSDYVKYVFLFDACDHEIIKQLQPKKTLAEM